MRRAADRPWTVPVAATLIALTAAACSAVPTPGPTASPPAALTPPPGPSPAGPSPAGPSPASPSPTSPAGVVRLQLERFVEGHESPTILTHAGDGSGLLYVLEQAGRVRVIDPDGELQPEPFLDITDRVLSGGERGLLGLAFHPAYPDDPRLFIDYTRRDDGATVVGEYQVAEGVADPDTERQVIVIPQPFANHNGGMVAFGPEGALYIAMGDGGGAGDPQDNGQDPFALLGKILRLDVDSGDPYAIPPDNPFAGGAGGAPEVWALGLRNPWRFSFDRETGDLWIGDVGQSGWEEVDLQAGGSTGGLDYGWNVMEGPECFRVDTCDRSGFIPPVAAYTHESGCTIIGGYRYRGSMQRALEGVYLFGDFCSGRLWTLDAEAALEGATVEPQQVAQAPISLGSFGEDEGGELYALDLEGTLFRIVAESAD